MLKSLDNPVIVLAFFVLLLFIVYAFIFFIQFVSDILVGIYFYRLEKNKRKRDKNYESYLEKVANSYLIFEYFTKIQDRLPENLHNIMIGYALIKNSEAIKYINSLDIKNNKIKDGVFSVGFCNTESLRTCLSK